MSNERFKAMDELPDEFFRIQESYLRLALRDLYHVQHLMTEKDKKKVNRKMKKLYNELMKEVKYYQEIEKTSTEREKTMRDNNWKNIVYEFAQFYSDHDNDEYSRPGIFLLADVFIEREEAKDNLYEIMDEYGVEQFKEWAEMAEVELIALREC